jgi:dCTP deaminase
MILNDREIRERGEHMISPFNPKQVEPASYDVRLGNHFRVFERDATPYIDLASPVDITKEVIIADEEHFMLHPGEFALGVTREVLSMPDDLVARIEGKSSVGRLGIMVHVTAGYIDPGFHGAVTLEMASLHPLPIMLRPGKLIAQLSFMLMMEPAERPYRGRYQGDTTVSPSRYAGEPVSAGDLTREQLVSSDLPVMPGGPHRYEVRG